MMDGKWAVGCTEENFTEARKDKKFPYIVALGRAINALLFVRAVMTIPKDLNTAAARRTRLNSYLFGSAIMYEVLKLIRSMGGTFKDDPIYRSGLRQLLSDPIANQIETDHLKHARHQAVFHFDADTFAHTINNEIAFPCLFITGEDKKRIGLYYTYADLVAAEILVGLPSAEPKFTEVLTDAVVNTDNVVEKFIQKAEQLISDNLARWGFIVEALN